MKRKFIKLSLAAAFILNTSAYAKEPKSLDTVTVTAQKTQENLQEVSASITVFDEFEIEDKNIYKVSDFSDYIPNFMSFQTAGLNGVLNPSLRGVSSLSQSGMSAVPIIIDGITLTSSTGYDISLLDIESIEVLRGPQGTLYGAGAEAGAISIKTKKPNNETKGKVGIELGSDDKRQYSFNASGPIQKDKLYIGLSGKYYEKEGYIKNLNSGNIMNDKENKYGKLYLRYTPNDNLDISLISSKSERDDGANNLNLLYQPREVNSNLEGYNRSDDTTHTLKLEYNWDKYNFESITSKRDYDMSFQNDFDYSSATKFHQTKSSHSEAIAQELRLSKKDDKFSWLFGLYGEDKDGDNLTLQDKATPNGMVYVNETQDTTSESLGIFANSKYKIDQKFSLVTGLRYDKVEKTLSEKSVYLKEEYKEVSPKLSLEYIIDKNMMAYTTIAKGFNPGGFNPHTTDTTKKSFGPEKLTSYEIGMKSSFLNNRITLNSVLFYMDLGNIQTVHNIDMANFYMTNTADGSSKGFELEVKAMVSDSFSVFANYGYNDVTFDNFSDFKGDYSGNVRPFSPKYNFSIGGQYRNENGLYARADMIGYGKMYTDNANSFERKAYELVNAKLGYEMENFDIYLYGKNIFDKNYDVHGFSGKLTVYSEPREIGVQLAYRF